MGNVVVASRTWLPSGSTGSSSRWDNQRRSAVAARAMTTSLNPAWEDPVVLVAGAGGNALAWYRYIEPLARTRPVLAVDPLGEAGRSVQTRTLATGAVVGG